MRKWLLVFACCLPVLALASSEQGEHLKEAPVNLEDTVSLQRGAHLFVNYCMGCHSLKYLRYNRMAADLEMPEALVQKYLNFTSEKPGEPMQNGLSHADGKAFFGKAPPDLTMETRLRSPDWVYSYLTGFYKDASRPFGYNNHVYPNVGMPNVMAGLQASMSEDEFHQAMGDLTNFLTYSAEPIRPFRERLGVYVLVFLGILFVPAYLLKKEYWKDVH
ncbi:ubiquinol-cytochrome c reductase cytochrome c1 subunit [Alcanivorax hongdengensis A-11-3]|uniref:Ubiquinol-cytochrome c reductase cytochrome c1 subunit n=1 Tax=Alcanivorax hongdengensis A-11-3 TaxID=1177179 RepID=L0WBD5_9GAMM|nr:cytochrome c1 [Alcanivorax hongdengensis]EKF74281.1 ubiquinol-cytochrome c reductase cytochrome c1 subunit [Alcanivorax hongdengensis A-11-3]